MRRFAWWVPVRFFLHTASWRGVRWWVNSSASPSPFLSLLAVLRAVRGSVGDWGARGWLSQALAWLLYRRLGGVCAKMERLAELFQAGRLGRIADRAVSVPRVGTEERSGRVACLRYPWRFGWLVRAAAWHAAGYGSQLRHVLGQPEIVALLEAAPQAQRILRPVCRMLMIEASVLRPRAVAVAAAALVEIVPEVSAPVVKVRVRRARVPVDWGRIPWPRGVLSAARRQGFGKVPRD